MKNTTRKAEEEIICEGRASYSLNNFLIRALPYVTTKNISYWSLNKVSLSSDWGFVARSHLLPFILTAFSLLILLLFLTNSLNLRTIGNREFLKWRKIVLFVFSSNKTCKQIQNLKKKKHTNYFQKIKCFQRLPIFHRPQIWKHNWEWIYSWPPCI